MLRVGVLCIDALASSNKSDAPKKSLKFNMARLSCVAMECSLSEHFVGPLLDNAAPYSELGIEEFKLLQPLICPEWKVSFDPLPSGIARTTFWQYGSGQHSSEAKPIIGSVLLSAETVHGSILDIRHLINKGASQ